MGSDRRGLTILIVGYVEARNIFLLRYYLFTIHARKKQLYLQANANGSLYTYNDSFTYSYYFSNKYVCVTVEREHHTYEFIRKSRKRNLTESRNSQTYHVVVKKSRKQYITEKLLNNTNMFTFKKKTFLCLAISKSLNANISY